MKTLIAAIAMATLSIGAFASEATQFDTTPSTLSRAEVKAATLAASTIRHHGEATVFVDTSGSGVTRAEVRAQTIAAIRAGHRGPGLSYGEATVFADPAAM